MEMQSTENHRNTEGLKRILAKFVSGDEAPQEVLIGPGTTTADLLRELKKDASNFSVSKGAADTIFGDNEVIYPQLEDGDLVYVASRLTAGE
jgi:hypothetical protein